MATIPSQPATAGTDGPHRTLDAQAKARLQRVVKEFEAVMLGYMLKSMRAGIPKDDAADESFGGGIMEGMFDQELAGYVARGSNLGLGEMLYKEITGEDLPQTAAHTGQLPRLPAPAVRPAPAAPPAPAAVAPPAPAEERKPAPERSVSPSWTGQPPRTRGIDPGAVTAPPDTVRRRLDALEPIIRNAADTTGVGANLLKAVIATESAGRAGARSPKNAKGLMQLIDSTAAAMGVRNVWDPAENVRGGARYLGRMMERFDGNLEHALASYNAGPGAVEKHGGIPPYRETQAYVGKVLEYLRYFEQQESGGHEQD